MTVNGLIVAANVTLVTALLFLGGALLWQARRSLRAWPVSALVALAGPYLFAGLIVGHVALWRIEDAPGRAFDRNGIGTLAVRLIAVVVTWALVRRIVTGHLLTPRDRARMDGGE